MKETVGRALGCGMAFWVEGWSCHVSMRRTRIVFNWYRDLGCLLTYSETLIDARTTTSQTSSPPAPSLSAASTPGCSTKDSASPKTSPHGSTKSAAPKSTSKTSKKSSTSYEKPQPNNHNILKTSPILNPSPISSPSSPPHSSP